MSEGRDPLFRKIMEWRGYSSILIGLVVGIYGLAGAPSHKKQVPTMPGFPNSPSGSSDSSMGGNILIDGIPNPPNGSSDPSLGGMFLFIGFIAIVIGLWMIYKARE